jgi:hypothetical protein
MKATAKLKPGSALSSDGRAFSCLLSKPQLLAAITRYTATTVAFVGVVISPGDTGELLARISRREITRQYLDVDRDVPMGQVNPAGATPRAH